MLQQADSFDLGRLGLSPGEARHLDLSVPLDSLEFGGERYEPRPSAVAARMDVTRTIGGGYSLRLRYDVALEGPCMRCLEDAAQRFVIDVWEVDQPGGGEELDSPYVDDRQLDLRGWARDALALELPAQIVCREECLGICAVCGENLNMVGPSHQHERPADPRWATLGELRFDDGG